MTNIFCPLYKQAIEAKPWEQKESAHAGLLFDKFASNWKNTGSGKFEFEKSNFLKEFVSSVSFSSDKIKEACQRQREMVKHLGGETIVLTNSSRFVTGMGREHPLENGFTWHHTLGVPFLPGSSLKGIVRAWYRELLGDIIQDKKGNDKWKEDSKTETLFGSSEDGVGQVICLDMLPLKPPTLVTEIMTPHYSPYYQDSSGKTAPGDWHNPVPIPFLAVEAGTMWQVAILPRNLKHDEINELKKRIPDALSWLGAGAKTAVGYGRFEWNQNERDKESQLKEEDIKQQEQLTAEKEKQQQLDSLSPEFREMTIIAGKENWTGQNSSFIDNFPGYLESHPDTTAECIEWIKENCLEKFWKGIWNNPHAKKGKKKDKLKYNKNAAEITVKLKAIIETLQNNNGS